MGVVRFPDRRGHVVHIVLCGPYPYDEDDRAHADGLMQCVVLLAHAIAAEEDVRVAVLSRSTKIAREQTREVDGVRVTWVPDVYPRADYAIGRRLLRRRLTRKLREMSPDIVNAHGEAPYIFAALDSGVPHVVTLHAVFAQQTRVFGAGVPVAHRVAYALSRRWEREYLPRVRELIAINDRIAADAAQFGSTASVHRVNNPIDPALFAIERPRPASQTVLFVGQLSRRKAVHEVVEAFGQVSTTHGAATLRVVGGDRQDPAYARELRVTAERVAPGRVTFTGALGREGVQRELAGAAVLCLPSHYEVSPLAVLEGMAAGLPVIASDVGDVSELLGDGAGIVTAVGDVGGLAAALHELLADQGMQHRMGALAREVARSRALPAQVARETISVFRQVTARARGTADRRVTTGS